LEQVENFKYLGAIIDQTGEGSREIKARLGAARSALRFVNTFWKDRAVNIKTKVKLLKTLVCPAALYGCKTWTLRAADIVDCDDCVPGA